MIGGAIVELYKRENYLKKIRGFYHDSDMIKVITGVRRCGKSSLMKTIIEELKESRIIEENIIFLDLDSRGYKSIKKPEQLEKEIQKYDEIKGLKYLFIDEIQNVKGFEEVINAYRGEDDYSIFITGSNSYLLSGELITKLTGRYIEFEMLPLSFEEYVDMKKAGIVDPTKVTRSALQNAASVASTFLTTEAAVVDIPQKEAPMPGAPGMGGMDGMY